MIVFVYSILALSVLRFGQDKITLVEKAISYVFVVKYVQVRYQRGNGAMDSALAC